MSSPTALRCPSCASNLRAEDIDAPRGVATCSYCGALMNLPAPVVIGSAFEPRPEIALPARVTLDRSRSGVEVRVRWERGRGVFLGLFAFAWNAFLVSWYSSVTQFDAPWIFSVFPLAHVAVGIAIAYMALAMFVNTTTVRVERRELTISIGPLPWRGNRRVERSKVAQLFARSREHRGRHSTNVSYELWMIDSANVRSKLISSALDEEQVLYLEQQLEHALALADRPVSGELTR